MTSLIIMTPSFDFYNIVLKNKVVFRFHMTQLLTKTSFKLSVAPWILCELLSFKLIFWAGLFKAGLIQNLNSDMKAHKSNSVLFFLSKIWSLHAPKRIEKITWENAFEQKKKKPGQKL